MKKLLAGIFLIMFPLFLAADDRYPPLETQFTPKNLDGTEGCFSGVLTARDVNEAVTVTGSNGQSFYICIKNKNGPTISFSALEEIKTAELNVASGIFCWRIENRQTILRSASFKNVKKKKEIYGQPGFETSKRDKDIQARDLHAQALGSKNKGNYDEANMICQAILVFHPTYEPAQVLLKDINKAMKQKEAEGHLNKAVELAGKGKILEASSEWQLALTVTPDDVELQKTIKHIKEEIVLEHNRKATELLDADKLIEAAAEWNLVLVIEKDDFVAKKGLDNVNKRLANFSLLERVKMQLETAHASAEKEYAAKNYLAAIYNYQEAARFAAKLQRDKETADIKKEIKRIESLVESSRKSYLENAARFADALDWLNTGKELRNCLMIDPGNEKAKEMLTKYKVEIDEVKEKLYLDGLVAYSVEDVEAAILKWEEVLILDPGYEKAALNIKKADRKRVKK